MCAKEDVGSSPTAKLDASMPRCLVLPITADLGLDLRLVVLVVLD